MRQPFEHFLRHKPVIHARGAYGRTFRVVMESWRLTDDPKKVKPRREVLVSGRTAADAADLARMAASTHPEHGFHKASGAWWASDGQDFHRFRIHGGGKPTVTGVVVASGIAGLAGVAAYLHLRGRKAASEKA
jgi:hypothetical protein